MHSDQLTVINMFMTGLVVLLGFCNGHKTRERVTHMFVALLNLETF